MSRDSKRSSGRKRRPKVQPVVMAPSLEVDLPRSGCARGTALGRDFRGSWNSDDARDYYRYISVAVTDGGRFCPCVPCRSGFGEPEFDYDPTFPWHGTLKEAIALCESYLAKNCGDW